MYNLSIVLWCASHCFPIDEAGKQDFKHMNARPTIKLDGKQFEAQGTCITSTPLV